MVSVSVKLMHFKQPSLQRYSITDARQVLSVHHCGKLRADELYLESNKTNFTEWLVVNGLEGIPLFYGTIAPAFCLSTETLCLCVTFHSTQVLSVF